MRRRGGGVVLPSTSVAFTYGTESILSYYGTVNFSVITNMHEDVPKYKGKLLSMMQ